MSSTLIHEIVPVGLLQCNCSILGDPQTREAIVVDPGDEAERILALIAKHKMKVKAILSTHAHIDHVGGLKKLHDATGAPVLMNEGDLELYRHMDVQAQFLGVGAAPPLTKVDELLAEGDVVRWGDYEARVLHTPGHTPGSVSLFLPHSGISDAPNAESRNIRSESHADDAKSKPRDTAHISDSKNISGSDVNAPWLLAGDTLFAGSIGRTDLWGGSYPEIIRSIRTKLLSLPEETIVFPGHGPSTTLAVERESNPFLQSS